MLRLKLGKAPGHPETPIGEDGPTAWLVDENGAAVFRGHVVAEAQGLTGLVSTSLRFVGEEI